MVEVKTLLETRNGKSYKNVVGVFVLQLETQALSLTRAPEATTTDPVKGARKKAR